MTYSFRQKKREPPRTIEEIQKKNLDDAGRWAVISSITLLSLIFLGSIFYDQHFIQGGIQLQFVITLLLFAVAVLGIAVVIKSER